MIDAYKDSADENQPDDNGDVLSRQEVEVGNEVQVDVAPATTLNTAFEHVGVVVELWKTSDGDRQAIIRIVRSLEEDKVPGAPPSCYNGCVFITRPWSAKDCSGLQALGPADEETRRVIEKANADVAYFDHLDEVDRLRKSGYTDPLWDMLRGIGVKSGDVSTPFW